MAEYVTKAKTIGDITVTISKKVDGSAGERLEEFLKWLSGKLVDPGYGVPEGGRPDQGLPPSGGRPDNTLPGGGGTPDNTLPGGGGRPTHPIAPGGGGMHPDNELPGVIGDNAKEIAKIILKQCFDCKQPK